MAEYLDPGAPDRTLERRRSQNPLRSMMRHLTVDTSPSPDGALSRGQSLIRRLSGQKSRSPSSQSDAAASRPGSRPTSSLGVNRDPALCEPCASLAAGIEESLADMDLTYAKPVNPGARDDFDKREYLLARLKGLGEENRRAATCPLCNLFWAVHVPRGSEAGEYTLLGLSSRDTSYLVDSTKMYDLGHPAKGRARGFSPGFLAVVSKTQVLGAANPDVDPDWFRESGMLFRTRPEVASDSYACARGRVGPDGRLAVPEPTSPSPSPSPWSSSDDGAWTQRGIWGREIGSSVDLSVAREWLRFCEEHHQGRCSRRPVSAAELEGFRLIDCAQTPPQVVERSLREDYVALSYVWGSTASETETETETNWPRVFQDAAAVTRDLGFRYLWIDRICTDDSRPREKKLHIERMDEIYEGAAVTIIATCGEDATHGLPGVGSLTRPPQPRYKFTTSDVTLVSSLKDPRLLIERSRWYTRGWTYQEALLARRRLVFTGQQLYWECEGMACPEALDLPLELYHDADERRMADFVRPGVFNGVSYMDGGREQWRKLPRRTGEPSTLSVLREADQHVVNYTKRELSRDEDSLSAFLGLLRRLEGTLARGGKLSNLVGVPIWAPADGDPSRPRTRHLFALSTSFWHHRHGAQARRRAHLPSWTWAGWSGPVELFSSIVVANGRKVLNHHYVAATQLTRNEPSSMQWTYAPDMVVLGPDGSVVYAFGGGGADQKQRGSSPGPPRFPPGRYALHVSNPLVLDRVKARTHAGGWMFNDLSVDVRMSRGGGAGDGASIRDYVQRHGRGEQMTVLWFVEEALVMLLVVERTSRGTWERVGRMRMAFPEGGRDVASMSGRLEGLLGRLPLRRLGEDIVIE